MSKKYLYYFSEGNDAFGGDKVTMKNTLGGKGAGLAEMTAAGMPASFFRISKYGNVYKRN